MTAPLPINIADAAHERAIDSPTMAKWRERAKAAERNRENMPTVSAFVNDMRDQFGEIHVRYAAENGVEYGTRGPEGVTASLPHEAKRRARKADPETSREAAAKAGDFAAQHAAAIFAYLVEHPEGCTYREVATGTGLEPVAVGRRLKELRERAGVYDSGEVREGCTVWKVRR